MNHQTAIVDPEFGESSAPHNGCERFWSYLSEFCANFDPLIDVIFLLQHKAVVVRIAEQPIGALHNIYLNPTEEDCGSSAGNQSARNIFTSELRTVQQLIIGESCYKAILCGNPVELHC